MNNFIYAHVFTGPAPLMELSSLKGKVTQGEIAGNPTWTLNTFAMLADKDPGAVYDEFLQWRSAWHKTWKLDSEHTVSDLSVKLRAQFPVWELVRAGGVLTNRDSVLLLNDLEEVNAQLRAENIPCVILSSPDDVGAIWSWPTGFEGVIASEGGTEIAVSGTGMEITCPTCGADPVLGWDIDNVGKVRMRYECEGAPQVQEIAPDLEQFLFSLTPGARIVNVLTQPGVISVARTMVRIEQACEMSETMNKSVFFTAS
jgi:hypothetical protein